MTSGLKLSTAAIALLTVVGLGTAPASAADLGGDCCADLEERIAELEATTARKGNRKVKLEVSGQVNEAIIYWDDGFESNAGIYTNDAARTRFRFRGEAAVADGWKAGYLLEIGVRSQNSKRFDQDNAGGDGNNGFDLRHSVWYVDSKSFGRFWMGLTGGAGESVTETDISGTNDVAKFADLEDLGGGLGLRRANGTFTNNTGVVAGGALTLRRLIRDSGNQPGEGRRYNMVRYDTPTWEGFTGTVNWGADDAWEVGLRYKGEFAGFQMVGAIAYGENSESTANNAVVGFECLGPVVAGVADARCNQLGGSIGILHENTGLYGKFAAGMLEDENVAAGFDDTSTMYAGEVGIQQKWFPLGKTTVFGQYYLNEGGFNNRDFDPAGTTSRVLSSEVESYSIGLKQDVDAAAMSVYAIYRHVETEATLASTGAFANGFTEFEDLDLFMAGGIIKF